MIDGWLDVVRNWMYWTWFVRWRNELDEGYLTDAEGSEDESEDENEDLIEVGLEADVVWVAEEEWM